MVAVVLVSCSPRCITACGYNTFTPAQIRHFRNPVTHAWPLL